MRKALGILIGCTLISFVMMTAVLALPSSTHIDIGINGADETDGVDTPWFELSKSQGDTVSWKNKTEYDCLVIFHGQSPFDVHMIQIAPGQTSEPKSATNAPEPPTENWPAEKVYKFYKYTLACHGSSGRGFEFDPGGGVKR